MVLKGDAAVTLAVPANSSWIDVAGYVGPKYGVLHMVMAPPPPGYTDSSIGSYSTNRHWYTTDRFIQLALNPNVLYNVTLFTTAATAGDGIYLSSAKVLPYDSQA